MFYQPNAKNAVAYEEIPHQPVIEQASVDWVCKYYGMDVAVSIYPVAQLVIRYVFAGFPEEMTHEAILTGHGLTQLIQIN